MIVLNGTTGITTPNVTASTENFSTPPVVGAGTAQGFSAYQSAAQTFSAVVKLAMNTLDGGAGFNNSGYDTGTYRYTPTVAGLYQVNGALCGGNTASVALAQIYKNGAAYKLGCEGAQLSASISTVSTIVYLNGTTDYIELWGSQTTSQANIAGAIYTYFNACLLQRTA